MGTKVHDPKVTVYRISVRWGGEYGDNVMHRFGLMEVDQPDVKIFVLDEEATERIVAHRIDGDEWHAARDAEVEWSATAPVKPSDMSISHFQDGRVLGECLVCPKRMRDLRDPRNGAAHSGHLGQTEELVDQWFKDHLKTEMHAYYRDNPDTAEQFVLGRFYN